MILVPCLPGVHSPDVVRDANNSRGSFEDDLVLPDADDGNIFD